MAFNDIELARYKKEVATYVESRRPPAPERRSVDQLRGIEGARLRKTYELLARQYGANWKGRRYDPKN